MERQWRNGVFSWASKSKSSLVETNADVSLAFRWSRYMRSPANRLTYGICTAVVVFLPVKPSRGNGRALGILSCSIQVRTEENAVIFLYRVQSFLAAEWKPVEQRVSITWTPCHFGGQRPWFVCATHLSGKYCGRRVAVLYLAGEVFACRKCYGLAYASQQGGLLFRNLRKSQSIRMRLGGNPDPFAPFPAKPRRMYQRTYRRLRAQAKAAEAIGPFLLARSVTQHDVAAHAALDVCRTA